MTGVIALLSNFERRGIKLALNEKDQLVSHARKTLMTKDVVETITIEKDRIVTCLKAKKAFDQPIIASSENHSVLSSSQSGLWFIEQYETNSVLYNMPVHFRLFGDINEDALQFALTCIQAKHGSLRTRFYKDRQGVGYQQLTDDSSLVVAKTDLSRLDNRARKAALNDLLQKTVTEPFDLEVGQLTRVQLVMLGEQEAVLMLTQHHIVSDGWSIKTLFSDIKLAYSAYQNNQPNPLKPTALTYLDYARWFNTPAFLDYHQQFETFWADRLQSMPDIHSVPLDKPRPASADTTGELVTSHLDAELWARFNQFCRRSNASSFIGLHAVFSLLLARLSGEHDIVIGSPLAYRERAEIEEVVGFFVNTIVLRTVLPSQQAFADYLSNVREQDLEAFDHQLYRFESLSELIGADRTTAVNPLFQIMLVYQARVDFNDLIPGCGAVEEHSNLLPAKTDLSVKATELASGVRLDWLYCTALWETETVQQYSVYFERLLRSVVQRPEQDIWAIPLYAQQTEQTTEKMLLALPQTYTGTLCPDRILLQPPASIAVIEVGERICYSALNARANQLAHKLIALGAKQGDGIGLVADRSASFVIGMLAIWRVGGATVPLDRHAPAPRLTQMCADAGIALCVGEKLAGLAKKIPFMIGVDVAIENFWPSLEGFPVVPPVIDISASDLAYIIFTSGSSGTPKGVMVEHGALANLMDDHAARFSIDSRSRMFNCMSLTFDAGNMTTLLPLCVGSELVFGDPQVDLQQQLLNSEATHTVLAVALLASLEAFDAPHLRVVGFGGEACPPIVVERWASRVTLINCYGPTEFTVTALAAELVAGEPITIGQSVNNTHALILDKNLNLCAPGIAGELCLVGLGIARGYVNRDDLTEKAFIDWSFGSGHRVRLYRTGDKARVRNNGDVEFMGRLDEQIKLRGYRIEPGEIEACLLKCSPAIAMAKVLLGGELSRAQQLLAYVSLHPNHAAPNADTLLLTLGRQLPEYMVPAQLVFLPEMPFTANGKIDVAALPEVDCNAAEVTGPGTALESQVLSVWQSIMPGAYGVEDDFFRLGGDSILSIQLTSRLQKEGLRCTVKDVFEAKTVRRLCLTLDNDRAAPELLREEGILDGEFLAHPIQQWFWEQPFDKPHHWNQAALLALPETLTAAQLPEMLKTLMDYHDSLRSVFSRNVQRYQQQAMVPALVQLKGSMGVAGVHHALTELHASLNPECGHNIAWALIEGHGTLPRCLFLAIHHLAIDAVSWRIISEDFASLFRHEVLPTKGTSYRQWGQALVQYAEKNAGQWSLWEAQTAGVDFSNLDKMAAIDGKASHSLLTLSREETARLQSANAAFNTETNELLMAALAMSMQTLMPGQDSVITLEGHGREFIDETLDISRTLGWFTSSFPVRIGCDPATWATIICEAKERFRQMPDKGIGFNALRYHHPQGQALSASPVVLNYLGVQSASGENPPPWSPVEGPLGESISEQNRPSEILSVHGGIANGELNLRQVGRMAQVSSDAFMAQLHADLCALINYCHERIVQHGPTSTPSDYPLLSVSQAQLDRITTAHNIETLLAASSLQEAMLYHQLCHPSDQAYTLISPLHYQTALQPNQYRRAWEVQCERFAVLRSSLYWSVDQPNHYDERFSVFQLIHREAKPTFTFVDLSSEPQQDAFMAQHQQQLLTQGFDLSQPCPMHISCFKLAEQEYRVLWACHHSIIDGWSGPRLMASVHEAYAALTAGEALVPWQDHAYIDNNEYGVQQRDKAHAFWLEQGLQCLPASGAIGRLFELTEPVAFEQTAPAVVAQTLTVLQTQHVAERCRDIGITPSVLCQYAWHRLVASLLEQPFTQIGNVLTGRENPVSGVPESVGLYINTLPIHIGWVSTASLEERLVDMQQRLAEMNQYAHQSLVLLGKAVGGQLFDSLFVFENYPQPEPNAETTVIQPQFGAAIEKVGIPLSVVVSERDQQLSLRLEFDGAQCASARAQHCLQQWSEQLLALVIHPLTEPDSVCLALRDARVEQPPSTHVTTTREPSAMLVLWQDLLGKPIADATVDLHLLGVDSLQQIAFAQQLSHRLNRTISVDLLLRHPSPAALQMFLSSVD
ncbi:non-ribosomal peptide synthetase [Teredinibacter purpureus]|uniref:non-ribosomal peptide synthetase n=1 Tax=Teredinibacter purpureus TaxID=2731756 RepID=UPI0005F85DD3|nr:non-ribosomal peptide synthetase [Teredinibacter purpureus]